MKGRPTKELTISILIIMIGLYFVLQKPKEGKIEISTFGEQRFFVAETKEFEGLTMTFNEIKDDSRCPIDVQCVQAGSVVVNITLKSGFKEETINHDSDGTPLEFKDFEISIIQVFPELESLLSFNQNDYAVIFNVEPIS